MESLNDQDIYERLFETRTEEYGFVACWSVCALVSVCAVEYLDALWDGPERYYLADIHRLAELMVLVSEEAPILDLERASIVVERLLAQDKNNVQ